MKYVVVDPSGSFDEGKGHTGIVILEDDNWDTLKTGSVAANMFTTRFKYWTFMMEYIAKQCTSDTIVIIESFMIRNNGFLIGKMPETIRFIGALEYFLESKGIKYTFQMPTQAKSRFKDDLLCRYIPTFEKRENGRYYLNNKMVNDHVRDALKHLLYFKKYKEKTL